MRFLFDPFLGILLATIALASLFPASGPTADVLGVVATAAVVLLFFMHGVRLPRENLVAAVGHWRLHLAILACTFALVPLLGLAFANAAPRLLPHPLWTGVLFLCCLPSTVQSSIAMVSVARGNVAAAVAAAAASNLIGIALTPALVGLVVQAKGGAGINFSGVWKIVLQLLLPFAVGHLLRPWLGNWATRQKSILTVTDRATIVLAVYSAFSAAVLAGIWRQVPVVTLLVLAGVVVALLAGVMLLARLSDRLLGLARDDRVALEICGSQKSLVSGVPMARVLFTGPDVGMAVLPVMIYHQLQLMVHAWLARRWGAAPRAGGGETR